MMDSIPEYRCRLCGVEWALYGHHTNCPVAVHLQLQAAPHSKKFYSKPAENKIEAVRWESET